jgi:prevent-host-death family protein
MEVQNLTTVTATELQSKTGAIIDQALMDPVQITRNNRSVVVLMSTKEYERLRVLEDTYWGEMANIAINMESVSKKDIDKLLERLV